MSSAGKFDYLVNVSEAAFQSMVIATIESFLVPGRCGKSSSAPRATVSSPAAMTRR